MAKKSGIITILIILAVILLAMMIMNLEDVKQTTEEIAQCIGQNSEVYVQLGCHACETQEAMFGEFKNSLNIILCNSDWDVCKDKEIEATPTWIINGQKYRGVQTIEKLQELTGC